MSQHRRRVPRKRRAGRRIGAFLMTTVLAALLVAGGAMFLIHRLPGLGADPLADTLAQIPASKSLKKLENERQKLILTAAAAQTFSVASSPKLTTPATPAAPAGSSSPAAQPPPPPSTPPDPGTAQAIAESLLPDYGWSASGQFSCLDALWNAESGWRYNAENASGAYGIPQALPGSKMASAGPDWETDPTTQIKWGLGYIKSQYGTPCGAWAFEEANGYY